MSMGREHKPARSVGACIWNKSPPWVVAGKCVGQCLGGLSSQCVFDNGKVASVIGVIGTGMY